MENHEVFGGTPVAQRPTLSVVVPFHDVRDYIIACLESLQRQSMTDLEVILVDDGSTDGTADLAQDFCASDPRFRLIRRNNEGPGPARNTGIAEARGRYLAFADSDDLIPRNAYLLMIQTLEETGSDIVAGNARRFDRLGVRESWSHRAAFGTERLRTSLAEFPLLAMDRMVWNKVYRRDFWDREALVFPDMLYEDYPVVAAANARAKAVDVLSQPIYYWRERDGGEASITQRKWEVSNLRDRVVSAGMVLAAVADQPDEVVDTIAKQFLHIDVAAVLGALDTLPAEDHAEVVRLARDLVAMLPQRILATASPFDRIQHHLVTTAGLDVLRAWVEARNTQGTTAPVRRQGVLRRPMIQLPFVGSGVVPDALYRVDETTTSLVSWVVDARWVAGILDVDLAAYINLVPMDESSTVKVWLEDAEGHRWPCRVTRYRRNHPPVTQDLSGVRLRVDPRQLLRNGARQRGFLTLMVEVRAMGLVRKQAVRSIGPSRARLLNALALDPKTWVQPYQSGPGFGLWFRRVTARLTDCVVMADEFELTGSFRHADPVDGLQLRFVRDSEVIEVPAEELPPEDDQRRFRARVKASDFVGNSDHVNEVEERTTWIPRLLANGKELVLVADHERYRGAVIHVGTRAVEAGQTVHGNLSFSESHAHPVVFDARWHGTHLVLSGVAPSSARPVPSRVLRYHEGQEIAVTPQWAVEGQEFELRIDPEALLQASSQHAAPIDAVWSLFHDDTRLTMARASAWQMPEPRTVAGHRVSLQLGRNEKLQILTS